MEVKRGMPVASRTRRGTRIWGHAKMEETSGYGLELLNQGAQQDLAIIIESENEEGRADENEITDLGCEKSGGLSGGEQQEETGRKGKFLPVQQKMLTNAVGQFMAVNNISLQDFLVILNEQNVVNTVLKDLDFYRIVSKVLPGRSIRSCYRFIRRCFNERNRKGKWSKEQETLLSKKAEETRGDWQAIGKLMGRTAQNAYDKYREMGEGIQRKRHFWLLRQFIQLLLLVNERAQESFLDLAIKKQREREKNNNASECFSQKEQKYNFRDEGNHLIEMALGYCNGNLRSIDLQIVSWTTVAKKVKGRSPIECKNKFTQLLEQALRNHPCDEREIIDFVRGLQVGSEEDISWDMWESDRMSWREARNRFRVLKRVVQDRSLLSFKEVVTQMDLRLSQKRNSA